MDNAPMYNYKSDYWLGWLDSEESMKCYTADFETTTDVEDCRVWAWCTCDIDNIDILDYGNDIQSFIEWCESHSNAKVYFHNLGFDGAFLMDWLLNHEWQWTDEQPVWHTFKTLISDMNQVYAIELYFSRKRYVKIYDSLKIIPLGIARIAKTYGLEEGKGELDYSKYREVGHILDDEECDYIRRDVQIAAYALKKHFDEGLTKITAGSNALYDYKKMVGGSKEFRKMFPLLDYGEDIFIRAAYRGGWTYCDPRRMGMIVMGGIVYDANSMYPSVMASCDGELMPYGKPMWFDGTPPQRHGRPLWIASVTCIFKIKPDHLPTVQIKGNLRFIPTRYIKDSDGYVTLTVTNIDWELMWEQYDIEYYHFNGGYDFKASDKLFVDYVNKWTEVKVRAGKEGNKGLRQEAKLQLNSLYGKFATRTKVKSRKPILRDNVLRFVDLPEEEREPVYLPVGVFITSYARAKIIRAAQKEYDRFLYSDTDSLHFIGTEPLDYLDIDSQELGKWKHESTFTRAKYLGPKCYAEEIDGELIVHVSGLPARCHQHVTLENFEIGAKYKGKLYTKRVEGGIVLVEGDMEIRERTSNED